MSPEDLTHGIAQPGPSSSSALPEITRILVQKHWEDSFGHVIANDEIAIGCSDIPAKSRTALPESSIRVRQLTFAAKYKGQPDRAAIESVFGRYFELLSGGQRLVILETGRGPVIGNDSKDPLAFRWCRMDVSRARLS
jgi:hypothetical protein